MESGEIDNGIITQGRSGQQPNSKPIIEVVDNTAVEPLTIISTVTSTTEATRIVTRRISVTTTTTKSTSSSTNNRLGAYVTSEKEEKEEEEREVEGYEVDEEDASVTDMSITPPPMTRVHNGDTSSQHHNTTTIPAESERKRICLVGTTVDDNDTISAAKSFGVPIVTSETAMEFVMDDEWMTYYVMNAFDGPMFEAIRQNKRNRILGPPALKSAAKSLEGLPNRSKPTYNYAMKGVATCFTGIRDKDVLTRLVNLIHAMGGSIKKDMNPNVTHLICNKSEGEKYQYAMIFGLVVVREEWVYSAWENRDVPEFSALDKEFTKVRALRPFEGLRICFFGFSAEEYQHMVDILDSNGGTATSLDDPKCSHVVMSSNGANFPESFNPTQSSPTNSSSPPNSPKFAEMSLIEQELATNMDQEKSILFEAENENNTNLEMCGNSQHQPLSTSSPTLINNEETVNRPIDETDQLSPIQKVETRILEESVLALQTIEENDEDSKDILDSLKKVKDIGIKRKRDSFDEVSLVSIDSFATTTSSAKKPKLIRTGSITRGLRRSMSFVAMKTPIANMIKTRRSSVIDPNQSITSITSIDSTFNESIKKPIKDTFRHLKKKITKSVTPKSKKSPEKCYILKPKLDFNSPERSEDKSSVDCPFKTPVAPHRHIKLKCQSSALSNLTPRKIEDQLEVTEQEENAAKEEEIMEPIVDEHTVQSKPEPYNSKTHIVKSDWFWYTIQNGFAYVADYSFGDYLEQIANTPSCDRRDSLPINFNKRKRKRLSRKEVKEECFTPTGTGKRRSSVSNAGLLSMSGSFLDCTTSPDKHSHLHSGDVSKKGIPELDLLSEGANQQGSTGPVQSSGTPSQPTKSRSMRYNHFMEFFHTESNYVGILNTILYLFKEPLENMSENVDEALLNKSEIKAIFGNFLSIHEVHKKMLDKLKEIHSSWSEDCLIGKIILDNRKDLVKAYPPYVNFFEQMKEALIQCDTQKPRFHAFLKINQAKPECGRQSLQDLMIRPVQRLPSISLLLNDTLKHTPKNNPDAKHLEEALRAIKEVMTYINEDKRKTDGQLAMFDIFNNIENCPPHLVSSHRCFVSRCEVTELSDQLSGRGDALMLFLFNDNMEVCKKRSRAFNSLKSPNNGPSHVDLGPGSTGSGVGGNQTKPYKHIKLMPLSSIRLVVDITDNPRAFALNCRLNKENKDKLYYFSIAEDMETDKILYLRNLCKQLAENACRTDAEKFLVSVESQELDIDLSDLNVGTLSKAFKFATRTRLKVGRAFSFNKTPSKLKRAVSTMMTSPFGSTNSLTPATQLAQMKLASCTNIDEIGEEGSDEKEVLVAPMSVQPTRKASKNGSLSVAALRRI